MHLNYNTRFLAFTCLFLALACKPVKKTTVVPMEVKSSDTVVPFALEYSPANSELLTGLLQNLPDSFAGLIANPSKYRLQIIYTIIDRDEANKPIFRHHYFNVTDQYAYPASTVKLPASVIALEKLNKLGIDGLGIHTPMFTEPLRVGEKPVFTDETSKNGKPSVGHYIKKILLVSDNDANNRLYEFLGQQPYNERLKELGFKRAQISHRLSIALTDQENRTTNPVWFTGNNGQTIYRQPYAFSSMEYTGPAEKVGIAYMKSGGPGKPDTRVDEPLDFTLKNRWPIKYAHLLTQWIMFPESQPENNRLLLSASDYNFLRKYMSMLPGESRFPRYDTAEYWPTYVKFLMTGSEKGEWPYPNVRIFNKVGDAYGFLLDAAYVADFEKNVEFMLSAAIYCNSDEVLNDDHYDYDSVGFPFMKALGQLIYQYECGRQRKKVPDLSGFRYSYAD